jgi:hypothetical protein
MAKPHWKPRNVTLTGNKALTAKQNLGSTYQNPEGAKDWFADEGFELSRQALIRMQANGWQGYGAKKKRGPRKITGAEVKAWMAANPNLAREYLEDVQEAARQARIRTFAIAA